MDLKVSVSFNCLIGKQSPGRSYSQANLKYQSKQGKRNDGTLPRTQVYLMDEDENGLLSRRNSNYSCASSITDEEGCGSRGGTTNVVARLMGLNSMPSPNSSTPFFDTQSICDSRISLENLQNYQWIPNTRPIEKFQTETLPPKSAKTIPLTQHKLLSPVKCPGFAPSRNPACIMKAAVKIIESSAPHSNVKSKGFTSGHLKVDDLRRTSIVRVQDMKQKDENTRKTSRRIADSDSTASRYIRGRSPSKSYHGVGTFDNGSSLGYKNRKSISLAIQAKINVQKREGLNSSGRHDVIFKKEGDNSKSNQLLRSKLHTQKKSLPLNVSGALKQNNHKQNGLVGTERVPPKTLISSASPSRKPSTEDVRIKSSESSQTESRKLERDGKEMFQSSSMRNFPRKKRSINQNKKQDQSSSVVRKNWVKDSRREGMGVVSFTFTAPLSQKSHGHAKLRGSTCEYVSSSHQASSSHEDSVSTTASAFQELGKTADIVSANMRLYVQKENDLRVMNKVDTNSQPDSFTKNSFLWIQNHDFQGIEDMELEEYDVTDGKKLLDLRHPRPVSVLEPSLASESLMSSESTNSNWTEVNNHSTTSQSAERFGSSFSGNSHSTDVDMDISDSASSLSDTMIMNGVLKKPTNWELEYVKEILSNVEKMYNDFTTGRSCSVVTPHLFEQLESVRKGFMETDDDGDSRSSSRLRRKALFDCVRECMELRFNRGGGHKSWETGLAMASKTEELVEQVHREIVGWRGMVDSIVDDLVHKDMTGRYGNWVEFKVEFFEIGVEIETELLSSLMEEAMTGIWRL